MSTEDLARRLVDLVGAAKVRTDEAARLEYGADALKRGRPADVVVFPESTADVVAIARHATQTRTPIVPRGAGTGYSGGAVPARGGIVLSFERMNRILEIDAGNLLAVVEPGVVTGDLQDAVERLGLFYPPDPASLRLSTIGGNVAECAGGPRALKYGVTRQYVLGLTAVLASGEVIRTGGKVVKNVVGYDLTQLLVGSEGTLAIITEIILRLVPLPPAAITLSATFATVEDAVDVVKRLTAARVVPSTMEVLDAGTLEAVERATGVGALAPAETKAVAIIEVDGLAEQVAVEAERVEAACRQAGATAVSRARTELERQALWRVRREVSHALMTLATLKINNDIVVPRARVPECYALIADLERQFNVRIPSFGHAGDGNLHVNIMVESTDAAAVARAREAEAALFRGVVALEGAISGEHGIGMTKSQYIGLGLSDETLALMRRVKQAFDPLGILNPGKIFPETAAEWR